MAMSGKQGRLWIAATCLAASIVMPGASTAQEPRLGGQTPTTDQASQPFSTALDNDAQRTALLREGSVLVEVRGTLTRAPGPGWWRYDVEAENPNHAGYAFTVLPSQALSDMIRIVESMPDERTVFEATGMIFVYRYRNYFLPTHVPRIVAFEPAATIDEEPAAETQPDVEDPETADAPELDLDPIEAIIRNLERSVGDVPRSSAPTFDEIEAEKPDLLPDGATVLSRRGRLIRDGGGAWLFVFDSDVTGNVDPPMILLPCLMLERMERYADRIGASAPLVISGHVHRFEDRNYLMPSMFQIPRQRTILRP